MEDAIVVSPHACETERFAAEELSRYLALMLGRPFRILDTDRGGAHAIAVKATRRTPAVRVPVQPADERFSIHVKRDCIELEGGSPRAALYAVYAFLEELGCRWFAPQLECYDGVGAEYVPKVSAIELRPGRRQFQSSFLYREVLLEECRSHDLPATRAMIDWLPKVRANVLHAPIDYQHSGRFTWDAIRDTLVPEMRKRGLIIAVGGHGYENFLYPDDFFDTHPEWFALIDGKRSRNPHHVFETSNRGAVRMFVRRVADYLKCHPEINILSLLPPDIVTWSEDPKSLALGSPSRRQGLLTHAVKRELARQKMPVALEVYTYDKSEAYPEDFEYDKDIIVVVDFYYQNHRGPIFDPDTLGENRSIAVLAEWTARHHGHLSYFHYYRRYMWQSRPAILPGILWADLRYLYDMGIRGMAGFAEPGDWVTFELQHYLAAKLYEDITCDVKEVVADYCRHRFQAAAPAMERYFWTLEKLAARSTRLFGGSLPSEAQIQTGRERLAVCRKLLRDATATPGLSGECRELLSRMKISLQHMGLILDIHEAEHRRDRAALEKHVARNLALVRKNRGKGLFVEKPWLTRSRFLHLHGDEVISAAEKREIWQEILAGL